MEKLAYPYLLEHYPVFAKNLLREHKRCNGFVPYEQGFVYVIHATNSNYYKIGKSVNPDRRLLQIAPQMPFTTRFIKVWPSNFMSLAESMMHKRFAHRRSNGEWFELDAIDLDILFQPRHEWKIRFAYTTRIYNILWQNKEEGLKFFDEFRAVLSPEAHIEYGMVFIEILFRGISAYHDPGLPEDIQASIRKALAEQKGGTK